MGVRACVSTTHHLQWVNSQAIDGKNCTEIDGAHGHLQTTILGGGAGGRVEWAGGRVGERRRRRRSYFVFNEGTNKSGDWVCGAGQTARPGGRSSA
jgi:hypothetical protein